MGSKELKKGERDYHIKLRLRRIEEHIKILISARALNSERINELEERVDSLEKGFALK